MSDKKNVKPGKPEWPRPEFGVNFRRVSLRDRYRQGLFSIMMHRVQVSAA